MRNLLLTTIIFCMSNLLFSQNQINNFSNKDLIITIEDDTIFGNVLTVNKENIRYSIGNDTLLIDIKNIKSYTIEKTVEMNSKIIVLDTVAASFKGGELELYKYLANNIVYPKKSKRKGIQGNIIINFIIQQDGSITNIHTVNKIEHGEELEKEAIRVVANMPNWVPASCRGECFSVVYNLPINFKLE